MSETCSACTKNKASLSCGLCKTEICKSCAQFVEVDQFSFMKSIPAELSHQVYCPNCFENSVAPAMAQYDQTMEVAKELQVFMKDQGKETRYIRRLEKPVQVLECSDENETLLRLAFLAAERGFNAIVDTDIKSKKVKSGTYTSSVFSGSAVPIKLEPRKLVKDRSLWQNPN